MEETHGFAGKRLAALRKPDAWSFFSIIIIYMATTSYKILQRQYHYSQLRSDSTLDGFPLSSIPLRRSDPSLGKTHTQVALIRLEITGSQGCPILGSPKDSPARYRPDPPRRPLPWQARRPPQEPRPGCSPRYRPLQDQRCSSAKSQRPIRHRHLIQGRHLRPGRCQDRGDLSAQVLHR